MFPLLEDEAGQFIAIVHPDLYLHEGTLVRSEPFLAFKGKLQKSQGAITISAQEIRELEGARASFYAPAPDSMEDVIDTPSTPPKKLEPASHNYRSPKSPESLRSLGIRARVPKPPSHKRQANVSATGDRGKLLQPRERWIAIHQNGRLRILQQRCGLRDIGDMGGQNFNVEIRIG
jgi:hypothetical protein